MQRQNMCERLSYSSIRKIERVLDDLYETVGLEITFSNHFRERVIKRDITSEEIISTFTKLYEKYRNVLKKDRYEALVRDIANYLSIPIEIKWVPNRNEYDIIAITIIKNTKETVRNSHGNQVLVV